MPSIPRRLPPTPEERLAVITTRMAGGSNAGSTRWAQPLNSSNYRAQVAPTPTETPDAPSGPEIHTSAITQRGVYTQYYNDDPDQWSTPFAITGLRHGAVYLVEMVFYITTEDGQAGSNDMLVRLDQTAPIYSSSEMWLDGYGLLGYATDAAGIPVGYQPDVAGVIDHRITTTISIAYGDAAETVDVAIQTRVSQDGPGGTIRAGTFARATYVGDLLIDS